ncbi:MAG: hypothetical protein A3H96_01355 [Acidobacteria bacterium RIFCSPLOWO2_02_FULL_67_36]|nr:MAG: hypothetical protein A3H96_01355 [Acidobacteria bacterium RIFCSPLOWO2_02_FULL_67_36]OFW20147.1 MAG: hypothetical protein A3G21_03895 [Acidobacteria bacterium RIFCSPLOWO2_12_FULL_66_21]
MTTLRPRFWLALAAAGLLTGGGTIIAGQTPATQAGQPTFRSGAQVVEVDVRVFDRDGRFIEDLTRDDFEVLEDGVPQRIQTLYLVQDNGVVSEPSRDTAVPPPGAAAVSTTPASARQTWIFFFDLNHLTPGGGFERARKAVEDFIRDRFKDGDLGGVIAGGRMVNNRLTSVHDELVEAVKSVKPLGDARSRFIDLTRDWPRFRDEAEAIRISNEDRDAIRAAITRACSDDADMCRTIPPDQAVRQKAKRLLQDLRRASVETLSALNGLASGLARIQGPKTVVFLSDGFFTNEMESVLRGVVGQTTRAGGRVYAIDVRGLNRGPTASTVDQMTADDPAGGPARQDLTEDGPNSLAVDTGGLMIRNENNLSRALETIARDANRYYVLGYQPVNATFDGKYHPIVVRVKRAGLRARARRGYLALEPAKMLVPQKIESTERPAEENAPAPGSAAPAPASAPSAVRLRPDAADRVQELSAGETARAGTAAAEGWAAFQRGDVSAAIGPLTEAAKDPGARPWLLYTLGLTQAALARPLDAAASWERVRQAAPEFEPVYEDLAAMYVQASDLTRALAVLRDAERRWPKEPQILNAIGVVDVRRGALDEAISSFGKAIEAAPKEATAYLNLGRAYELRYAAARHYVSSERKWVAPEGDRQKAIENYKRYIDLGGPYASQASEALIRLGWSK